MAEKITPELFNHLVDLAALALTPDEVSYLREELNNQLVAIDELAAIPLAEDTPIAAHGVPYPEAIRQPIREDSWEPCEEVEDILAEAPELDDRYIVVPEIPHEELE